jgi:hypothetical protein
LRLSTPSVEHAVAVRVDDVEDRVHDRLDVAVVAAAALDDAVGARGEELVPGDAAGVLAVHLPAELVPHGQKGHVDPLVLRRALRVIEGLADGRRRLVVVGRGDEAVAVRVEQFEPPVQLCRLKFRKHCRAP